MAMVVFQIERF